MHAEDIYLLHRDQPNFLSYGLRTRLVFADKPAAHTWALTVKDRHVDATRRNRPISILRGSSNSLTVWVRIEHFQ